MMQSHFLLSLVLLFSMATAALSKDALTAEFKNLFIGRMDAFAKNDAVELDSICTKNYQFINPAGSKCSLNDLHDSLKKHSKQMKSYQILTFQPYVAEDESMAFAVSEVEEEIPYGDSLIKNNFIVTEIYRKENKKWKLQLTQISQKVCNYP
jgi:hypothetical protein